MILNRRQTTLLYELLSHHEYLSYPYLCDKTHSCEKTVRSDVKILNNMLEEKNISISLKKNKGFLLECDEAIRSNLVAKYLDGIYNSADLNQLMKNNYRIIECVFNTHEPVKIETLAAKINISQKSVSALIKVSKPMFNNYGIKLIVKPNYGIQVEGDEKSIRYLLSDLSYSNYDNELNSIFGEGMSIFGVSKEEILFITEKLMGFVYEEKLQIAHIELRKICARIIFGIVRSRIGFYATFTKEQKSYLDEFFSLDSFDSMIDDIENQFKIRIGMDERYYFKMIFLASLDFSSDENYSFVSEKTRIDAHKLSVLLARKLISLNIIDRVSERRFSNRFYPTCISAIFYKLFGISEDCPNSILKEIVCGTPLASNISNILYKILRERLDFRLGEVFRLNLALSIYTAIREIDNKGNKIKIAIYTSADKQSGETLKSRILDRYAPYIDTIDIASGYEVLSPRIADYDWVVYYGNKIPYGVPKGVKSIHLDYFFPLKDSRRFYKNVIISSSKYERSFVNFDRSCYEPNCDSVKSLEDLDRYIRKLISSDKYLTEQYNEYSISSAAIDNETLNVILFAKDPKQCLTKMLKLSDCIQYQSTIISRVFINVICINNSPIALKTSEKILRNVTTINASNEILFGEKPVDFYHYFIYNDSEPLE